MQDDLMQSAFTSFFPRVGRGCYNVPDGDELWKLLLVVAAHELQGRAGDDDASRRDSNPTINRMMASTLLNSPANIRESSYVYLELVIEGILERLPPQNRVMVKLRLDGCEVAEVARLTGRSRRSVERILQESRVSLGAFLQEEA